jgi:predicted RNase H-like HicB family nuclease
MKGKNNIQLFQVIIEACEEGGYFASCPTLQGCHAEGESYSDAIKNIEEVIKAHLDIRKEHKEVVSEISLGCGCAEKVNISLPIMIRS